MLLFIHINNLEEHKDRAIFSSLSQLSSLSFLTLTPTPTLSLSLSYLIPSISAPNISLVFTTSSGVVRPAAKPPEKEPQAADCMALTGDP
jgi:hypothetical protein